MEDDELLKAAIATSKKESAEKRQVPVLRQQDLEEDQLQKVLRLSAMEAGVSPPPEAPTSSHQEQDITNDHDQEEDEDPDFLLAQAMELSMQNHVTNAASSSGSNSNGDVKLKRPAEDHDHAIALQMQQEYDNELAAAPTTQPPPKRRRLIADDTNDEDTDIDDEDDNLKTMINNIPPMGPQQRQQAPRNIPTPTPNMPHQGSGANQPRFLSGQVGYTYVTQWNRAGYFHIRDLVQPQYLREAVCSAMVIDETWLLNATKPINLKNLVLIRNMDGEKKQQHREHYVEDWIGVLGFPTSLIEVLVQGWGLYHPKFMLLKFDSFVRIVIGSSNLYAGDWEVLENCLYVQDFPLQKGGTQSEFSTALQEYITAINLPAVAGRVNVREVITGMFSNYDFSAAKGVVVGSVKGNHSAASSKFGLVGLAKAVASFKIRFQTTDPIYYQTSSMGGLNQKWASDFVHACRGTFGNRQDEIPLERTPLRVLYPTKNMVAASPCQTCGSITLQAKYYNEEPRMKSIMQEAESSREGALCHSKVIVASSRGILPPMAKHEGRRPALIRKSLPVPKSYLPQALEFRNRGASSSATPPSNRDKTNSGAVGWIYVGSHNSTKAAWGDSVNTRNRFNMNNYELGVVIPYGVDGRGVGVAEGLTLESNCVLPGRPYGHGDEPYHEQMYVKNPVQANDADFHF
ncbi:hypothetical protein SmJEL517_g04029 [Synchytrium microbalum]|uniref:PLD phosphodiesterase domain-containing protein n=1 Tax=Synchytrium microbalum TaxID=1806994 RepID=A0A507C652_9FUNG|nr:uncharacterized protein SmJEL517_g04029 [Synchytrium microbalum]TPX33023.1 hypothetical protein SmJEL517_g04029 [Synchytrium microbalum]